jgi:hypothetical protein
MSVSALFVRVLVEAVTRAGASTEALFEASNIDRRRIDRVEERFEFAEFARLQERAAELVKDPALGLHMAKQTSESSLDLIGYLVGHAPTLRDAVNVASRFGALVLDGGHVVLRDSADLTTILTQNFTRLLQKVTEEQRSQNFASENEGTRNELWRPSDAEDHSAKPERRFVRQNHFQTVQRGRAQQNSRVIELLDEQREL